jgi:hypothetical protein
MILPELISNEARLKRQNYVLNKISHKVNMIFNDISSLLVYDYTAISLCSDTAAHFKHFLGFCSRVFMQMSTIAFAEQTRFRTALVKILAA